VSGFLKARDADVEGSGAEIARLVQEGQKLTVAIKAEARDDKGPVLTRRVEDPNGQLAAAAMRATPPRLISRARMLMVRLADAWPRARIIVDSPTEMVALRKRERGGEVVLHQGGVLFETAGVEEQVERALGQRLALASGAALLFEPVRTLTAVDVDSAQASEAGRDPAAINLEAAPVLAQQLRLRNLGGLVVVDFLNAKSEDAGRRLVARLNEAFRDDPAVTIVDGPSRFGVVEIARRRRGPTLAEQQGPAPLAAAERLVRRLRREAMAHGGAALEIRVSPEVAAAFQGDDGGRAVAGWLGRRLELIAERGRPHDDIDIAPEI
jgi:Ribonuclease G/E